ncbi:hypothetical protein DWZ65_00465 [Roseburia sp. AF34-16]|jgi:hypothetical protein|uniref:hypothetical protein n=1 Tax=Roseburia sp. AF34-16 TaxID=2293136 RepID=UPI000E524D1C|nr:hypothetical protein [Roseburia sp. AF34-16]RGF60625.1 hypothetical protein DWZ65_00465 [Roseburia sp. AF34-16]
MTENEAIKEIKCWLNFCFGYRIAPELVQATRMATEALKEVQQYRAIGTPEECLRNKDFLDFISDKMNPNDFETYLRLYNALEEKGCEE